MKFLLLILLAFAPPDSIQNTTSIEGNYVENNSTPQTALMIKSKNRWYLSDKIVSDVSIDGIFTNINGQSGTNLWGNYSLSNTKNFYKLGIVEVETNNSIYLDYRILMGGGVGIKRNHFKLSQVLLTEESNFLSKKYHYIRSSTKLKVDLQLTDNLYFKSETLYQIALNEINNTRLRNSQAIGYSLTKKVNLELGFDWFREDKPMIRNTVLGTVGFSFIY